MVNEIKKETEEYVRRINACNKLDVCGSGISLLFFSSQMMNIDNMIENGQEVWEIAKKLMNQIDQYPDVYVDFSKTGMYGELGLLAFSVREILKKTGDLKDTSELLNRLLLANACQKADGFRQKKLWYGTYDILEGIAGIVYYLLDCPDILEQPKEKLKLRDLIRFLIYLSEDYVYRGKHIVRYHIRRKQQFLRTEQTRMRHGHINFGVAHGIAGPLVTLAKAWKMGMLEIHLDMAVGKLFNFYESFCVEQDGILQYPRRLSVEDYMKEKSTDLTVNSGWCYGNLGIVRELMKAAKYIGDQNKYQYYLGEFVAILAQPAGEYHLSSPIVCHGYGSVVSLQTYAFIESGDKRCLINLERNLEILLREHQKKMVESEIYRTDLSLLNGSGGVILAMQNSVTRNLSYGKILLMD